MGAKARHAPTARGAAQQLHAEYERVRAVRHTSGNHAKVGHVDDLTREGAQRVLGGPELVGVLENLARSPQRAA